MTLSSKKNLAKTLATASLATLGVTACTQNPFGSTQTANAPQSTQDVQTQQNIGTSTKTAEAACSEGVCGEAKCGASTNKVAEAACSEGVCGEAKCGASH